MNEFTIQSCADGVDIYAAMSECEGEPRGIIQFVHGMCEHKERYYELMNYLSSRGFVCVICDHRGHGTNALKTDTLGYMGKGGWMSLVEDTLSLTKWIKAKCPSLPLTLLGHSMGSMVVRSFTKRYDDYIDKLIVCGSPSDNPAKGLGVLLARFFEFFCGEKSRPNLLQAISLGSYNKGFEAEGYPCAWVCSDRNVLKAYHKDPLCAFRFTANGFKNLFLLMSDCYSSKRWSHKNSNLKVHFISGENDPCMGSKAKFLKSVEAMRKVGYTCTYKIYPNMRHEIHNETEKQVVWEDIVQIIQN